MDTADLRSLGQSIVDLSEALDSTQAALTQSEADLAVAQGQVAELEGDLADLRAKPTTIQPLFADPFTAIDDTHWNVYDGAGQYAAQGARDKRNVEVKDGVLSLYTRPLPAPRTWAATQKMPAPVTVDAGGFTAAGYELDMPLTPGVRVTFDLTATPSAGTRTVALTWPTSGWPTNGEIDFIEMGGVADGQSARTKSVTNNHFFDATKKQNNGQDPHPFAHDFTKQSHVELTWLPNAIIVVVDGVLAWCYTTNVPKGPMHLVFQTAVEGGGQSATYGSVPREVGVTEIRNLKVYNA